MNGSDSQNHKTNEGGKSDSKTCGTCRIRRAEERTPAWTKAYDTKSVVRVKEFVLRGLANLDRPPASQNAVAIPERRRYIVGSQSVFPDLVRGTLEISNSTLETRAMPIIGVQIP